ncbi:ribonuclease J [Roseibium sp. RKSG952]|uniref:ribonuclease J n=1 Tax=Roseibium sp. RKSG952 TaxID=2529384 RepID=UPI0012BC1466|nr:ribonuclease J [Roseibium sp. RKSG952]MTH94908.1 ribonuclease J [Roseibium sp. RKSG952]
MKTEHKQMSNDIVNAPGTQSAVPRASCSKQVLSKKFPRPTKENILVCPVGGVGRIGMNWTLYGYDGKWILVDAGSMFAPKHVEGVEAIYPDPESFARILPDIEALVVTHAHEDHIGAIHRLFPRMKCPIYATPYAAEVIGARLKEKKSGKFASIIKFQPGRGVEIGPFKIQTIRMTHSAPECVSLAISTGAGTVFHSGDWKFDPDPVIGKPTDFAALKRVGRANVRAMVCDSTNAHLVGETTSESDVAKGMEAVCRDTKGLVVVSIFSSNIARLSSIANAATKAGRKVALAGFSLIRNAEAAHTAGLLKNTPELITDLYKLKDHKRDKIVLICTGTQGEANAALARLAHGDDKRLPDLMRGDAIVHSARIIPGNEIEVGEIFSKIQHHGATIHQREYKGLPLHVTGHATGNEIAEMYDMIRPRFAIPVHGKAQHLEAHAKIALEAGVRDVAEPGEGIVYMVSRRSLQPVARVPILLEAHLKSEQGFVTARWDPINEKVIEKRKVPVGVIRKYKKRRQNSSFRTKNSRLAA